MKSSSPLLGFNHNFKHKGQIYHIQTEDSGVKHPHVITHLFADGGRILKSIKTSYANWVGDAAMSRIVRQLMQDQHKAMIIALRDGKFDPGGSREVELPHSPYFVHTSMAAASTRPRTLPDGLEPTPSPIPSGTPASARSEPSNALPTFHPLPTVSALEVSEDPTLQLSRDPHGIATDDLRVDVAALAEAARASAEQLPPSWQGKTSSSVPAAAPLKTPSSTSPIPDSEAPIETAPIGRYALTRPASIFATNRPAHQSQGSIFGDDLLSERSLDEVILSYLAADLDADKR